MKNTATISLANITKRFGDVEAVSDITLVIKPGEIVGFIGPNGAGKTTTLSLLMGFLKPTAGTVTVLGERIVPHRAHRVHRRIGYVAGDMVLPGSLTGRQFLQFQASVNGRDESRYQTLLGELEPVLHKPLRALSRGNKQKIALIAALQHAPEVLILDEPTSGLDPLVQDVFLAAISRQAQRGTTVLMSSHILDEVSLVCDRILFMRAGKLIVDKPLGTLLGQRGKQVTIRAVDTKKLTTYLPAGVEVISQQTGLLKLSVPTGELTPFLRWIVSKNIDDLDIEDRDLDDIFHEYYTVKSVGTRR